MTNTPPQSPPEWAKEKAEEIKQRFSVGWTRAGLDDAIALALTDAANEARRETVEALCELHLKNLKRLDISHYYHLPVKQLFYSWLTKQEDSE